MKRLIYNLLLVGSVILGIAVAGSAPAAAAFPAHSIALNTSAQTAVYPPVKSVLSSRGGVTISPAFQQINIDPTQPATTYDFKVTNNSTTSYEFELSVVDFGSLDETGGVLFIGNAEKALSYKYALSPWVVLEKDRIVVEPGATEKVPVTVQNKESLAPGGHYGAIVVTLAETSQTSGRKVQINQVLSSLLFVKKLGGEVYGLGLGELKVRTHFFGLPNLIDLRFQNFGNVHVIPRGLITVTDPRGKIVQRGIINADSGIALPETYRMVKVPLQSVGSSWIPGRYKVILTYRYDDQIISKTMSTSFVYLNAGVVTFSIVLVVLAIVSIGTPKLRHKLIAVTKKILRRLRRIYPLKQQ